LNRPTFGLVAIAVLALASSAVSIAQTAPAPTPVPTAGPTAAPTAAPGRRGKRADTSTPAPNSSPTDVPEPPQFATMDGVWEVQLQPANADRAVYSHLFVTQKGDALTGTWKRDEKSNLEFTGTFDGRLFSLKITEGAKTYTMSGYAENFGDMVGLLSDGDPKHDGTPFTASHRKKEKLGASV
jgi:hypothetical protein